MIPELFRLGPVPVNSFGLMVALCFFVAIHRLAQDFQRASIPPHLAEKYVLTGGFAGLIAARIWYIAEHWASVRDNLMGAILSGAGFTFYGGFLVSFALVYFMSRRDKLPLPQFVDSLGPALSLGYAVGRLGCQLSGDGDYGIPTESWFGMSYATGVVPTPPGILVFPTPLYESTLSLLICAVLLWVSRTHLLKGSYQRFGLYLTLISLERFTIEFLRVNPKITLPATGMSFSEAQFIAVGLLLFGLFLLLRKRVTGGSRALAQNLSHN